MKTILALGASSSRQSINRAFAGWAASRIPDAEVRLLDLNDFEMPMFSVDREEASGIPGEARAFKAAIEACDGIVLSLAEHNGSYTAAFKSLLDWTSRLDTRVWAGKPMLLLSTSPGGRGGASVMAAAERTFPHLGAEIAATFSLPSFHDQFSAEGGIEGTALAAGFDEALGRFVAAIGGAAKAD